VLVLLLLLLLVARLVGRVLKRRSGGLVKLPRRRVGGARRLCVVDGGVQVRGLGLLHEIGRRLLLVWYEAVSCERERERDVCEHVVRLRS